MRKWTWSACVVAALGIVLLLAVNGSGDSAHPAQANITIASSTQAVPGSAPASLMTVTVAPAARPEPPVAWVVRPGDTLSAIAASLRVRGGWPALYAANRRAIGPDPGLIRPGTVLALPGRERPASYTVVPGDTLSAIAAALQVRGGWPALYAANRRVIGPDPALIRPGTVLAVPTAATAQAPAHGTTGGTPAVRGPGSTAGPGSPGTASPGSTATAGAATPGGAAPGATAPPGATRAAGVMPRWLKATLLAVGAMTVISFLAQPAVVIGQRRRRAAAARAVARQRDRGLRAAAKMARIVQADHERLIVTYCTQDDTIYLLTPPGEDPQAVLRAARLILPQDTYEDLADHLGAPVGWQRE